MDTSAMSDAEFANAAVQYGVVWLPFFAYHLQQPAGKQYEYHRTCLSECIAVFQGI